MSNNAPLSLELSLEGVDQSMMARCIELSKSGAAAGELPFGSLIAHRGKIIAEATNEVMRLVDESRHAEIIAIAQARRLLGDQDLAGCTLYSTVEPCPMCSYCIRTAGIGRVVFALASPRMGGWSRWNILSDDECSLLFGNAPELVSGVLADDAFRVWVDVNPIVGRAISWFGFLTKPQLNEPASRAKLRVRYSLRRLISVFLAGQKSTQASAMTASLLEKEFFAAQSDGTDPDAHRSP